MISVTLKRCTESHLQFKLCGKQTPIITPHTHHNFCNSSTTSFTLYFVPLCKICLSLLYLPYRCSDLHKHNLILLTLISAFLHLNAEISHTHVVCLPVLTTSTYHGEVKGERASALHNLILQKHETRRCACVRMCVFKCAI